MLTVSPSYAKINLSLAITGKRSDGFHNLVSLVACIGLCDSLEVNYSPLEVDTLVSDADWLDCGPDNLVLKATQVYRQANAHSPAALAFELSKQIPAGAGLGGGSSNAAATLRIMNELAPQPLSDESLTQIAATLGSDVPLFLHCRPHLTSSSSVRGQLVVMRGRGEELESLPTKSSQFLSDYRVAVFKPAFSIPTPLAYKQLADAAPGSYLSADTAEIALHRFTQGEISIDDLLFNSFEAYLGKKYIALPTLLLTLRQEGFSCLLSGSGSACFALIKPETDLDKLKQMVIDAWGEAAYLGQYRLML